MSLVLVLGGVRSGKSEFAERMARQIGAAVTCIATGSASDPEMSERIALHRERRPAGWQTVETTDPAEALAQESGETILIDGIGGWLTALMDAEGLWTDEPVAPWGAEGLVARGRALERIRDLASAAARRRGTTIVVAEEAGLGLVPNGAAARRFLDLSGEAVQILAEAASQLRFVIAGRCIDVMGARDPVPAEFRLHGDSMVPAGALDFAVNVVAEGPPQWLRDALAAALDRCGSYPDESRALRAIADRHARSTDEILPLNGSAEAFWLLAAALRSRRPVCIHPTFTEGEAAFSVGARVERCFRNPQDFLLDTSKVPDDADLVLVCNPNNPTGTLEDAALIERLVRPGRIVVVDEAFMEFVPGEAESLASRGDLPGLVVLRSLTKLWSLPGIRAAYLLAPSDVIAAVRAVRQPWSVNSIALAAIEVCSTDEATPRKIAEEIASAREELGAYLAENPRLKVWPSAANFLLIEVPDGPRVRAVLLSRGIAVRRADTFPGLTENHLRVTVRRPSENRILVEALEGAVR